MKTGVVSSVAKGAICFQETILLFLLVEVRIFFSYITVGQRFKCLFAM